VAFTPYNAALDLIARSRAILAQADGSASAVAIDQRRLAVVMAVAALDTYMHRLILEKAYLHETLPGGLASLSFRFDYALEQADAIGKAARSKPKNSRPRVELKKALRARLLQETFQRYEDVSAALGMAGLSGNWSAIGAKLVPPLEPKEVAARLNAIVDRRNRIVHEGDYERRERPQKSTLNPIGHAEAGGDVDFLAGLIEAIHAVA
jgi:hypothetical protein